MSGAVLRVVAVVPAAGSGTRFGAPENKLWQTLAGRSILHWSVSALAAHPRIDGVVVVGSSIELQRIAEEVAALPKLLQVVSGGASRTESVRRGLENVPSECEVVLVHDAARPNPPYAMIDRVLDAVEEFGAAVPGLPVWDTLKRVDEHQLVCETVDRNPLRSVQTPQGAKREWLEQAYDRCGHMPATDESGLLEAAGFEVKIVPGEEVNLKVTRPEDIVTLERLIGGARRVRTGMGYDVHPFEEGRPLWLGGVNIPHSRGLRGHSDADALIHAVCDALLGAAGLGDIGVLFPDSDARHKDRPSVEFLQEVGRLLSHNGWRIENVDVALLAEEPRVMPHRLEMMQAMSAALCIEPSQVNIKATTCEGMGFVGRREGIACWATATLVGG